MAIAMCFPSLSNSFKTSVSSPLTLVSPSLYFSSLINSQYHNHNLKRLVTGSAQLGINQENLNKYKLRFSDCLELQKKYSKLIQLINEKLFIEKKLLYDLYNQKNYLMKNMFI